MLSAPSTKLSDFFALRAERLSGIGAARHKWRKVTGDPGLSYKVSHEYTILGYDLAAGTLDIVVRWEGDGGVVFFANHSGNGLLYEMYDEDMKAVADITMETLVADWKASA